MDELLFTIIFFLCKKYLNFPRALFGWKSIKNITPAQATFFHTKQSDVEVGAMAAGRKPVARPYGRHIKSTTVHDTSYCHY